MSTRAWLSGVYLALVAGCVGMADMPGNGGSGGGATATAGGMNTAGGASAGGTTGTAGGTTGTAGGTTGTAGGAAGTAGGTGGTAGGSTAGAGGASTFATRCAAPGVLKCVGFDAPADIAGGYGANSGILSGATTPTLDTQLRASGNSSIRFTIPSNSGSDTSGSFFTNFSADLSAQIGGNEDLYVQWRQRFSAEFINTQYAGGGGWKQIIIGTGDQPGQLYASCTALEVVVQNTYQRGYAQMYNSCTGSASHGPYFGFEEPFGASDFKLQNARPSPYCLYSQSGAGSFPPGGNCFGYFPDEWMTFQVHIRTGPRTGDEFVGSRIELRIAREGRPSEPVVSFGPFNLTAGNAATNQRFGKVWLLPYHTGKSAAQAHPTAFTWYDELIISRQPIADPTGGDTGGGTGGGSGGAAGGAAGGTSGTAGGTGTGGASGTTLAQVAAAMAPNSWAALTTTNIDATLGASGADSNHLGYTDDITYDPTSQKFFYLGGDHADLSIFASFDAVTGAWARLPRAPWMPPPTAYNNGMMHAYDHSAIDPVRGVFYHRQNANIGVHRYTIATQTWDSPPIPTRPTTGNFGGYVNCCDALEWFPELNGLVWVSSDGIAGQNNGHVYLFSETTQQWSVLASNVDLAGTWTAAEYNPVQRVLLFYSAQTNKAYKLDAQGQVTAVATPPFTWYTGSSYATVLTVDRASGRYLALSAAQRQLYTYDVPTDTWAAKASSGLPDFTSKPVVGTPVQGLGVNFFAACRFANLTCRAFLYKP